MSQRGLFDRLDDTLNPVLVKELRQAVRSKMVAAALGLFLVLQIGFLAIYLLLAPTQRPNEPINFTAGRFVFTVLQAILLGTCMLLIPAYAGGRLANELSDNNVDLLFITSLRPGTILAGKLMAAIVLVLVVFSACAPFMMFTYLLRGVDMTSIFLVLGIDFLAVIAGIQWALFIGAVPTNRGLRGLLGLMGFLGMVYTFLGALFLTIGLIEVGPPVPMDTWLFWGIALAAVGGAMAGMGLMFVWSVAMLNPNSSNRMLLVRLYMLSIWVVSGVVAGVTSYWLTSFFPLSIWMVASLGLFSIQVFITTNEREKWGVRVAKTIPRSPLLRVPAFLLYSGSAGGVLFAVLILGLTLGISLGALELVTTWRDARAMGYLSHTLWILTMYGYCYCMTAVFVRFVLLGNAVKPLYTWAVTTFLFLLGNVLPYLIAYLAFPDELRFRRTGETWWLLTNPFESLEEAWRVYRIEGSLYGTMCFQFVSSWAAIITVMNLYWFARQMIDFKPFNGSEAEEPVNGLTVENRTEQLQSQAGVTAPADFTP